MVGDRKRSGRLPYLALPMWAQKTLARPSERRDLHAKELVMPSERRDRHTLFRGHRRKRARDDKSQEKFPATGAREDPSSQLW